MTQATILIPTHAERPTLELSLRSALAQTVPDLEVFVVGDGCPQSTRELVQRLMSEDARLRFFDFPKGERHGEAHRHAALAEASGSIVSYLSDDDLLYPDHVEVALECLRDANFMAPHPCFVSPDGEVRSFDGDVTQPRWRDALMRTKRNFVPLTGVAHTMALYRSLDVGWSPAPPEVWTDLFMWRKFLRHTDLRPCNAPHVTCLVFPTPARSAGPQERRAELAQWASELTDPVARARLERRLLAERRAKASEHALYREQHALRVAQCEKELLALKGTGPARLPAKPVAASQLADKPLFVVSANCYSAALTSALRAMFPDVTVQAAPLVGGTSTLVLDQTRSLLARATAWVTVTHHELAEGLSLRTVALPSMQFAAFHPDITYARHATSKVLTAQHYNSRIGVWAYQHGVTPRDASRLYDRTTYEALGYTALWDASVAMMRRSFAASGFEESDADRFLARIKRRGLFMHSHNHPRVEALVELAKMVATKLGASPALVEREVVIPDPLTDTIWPVYPEIAERYGLPGNHVWRVAGREVSGVESYLTHAFAEYARQGIAPSDLEMVRPPAGLNDVLTARRAAL